MNLIINSIDAMKNVNGVRELVITSSSEENYQILVCVSDTGVGLPPKQADQIFNRSSQRSLMGPAWDYPSAAPSLSRIAAACGLPIIHRAAQVYTSFYLPMLVSTLMTP